MYVIQKLKNIPVNIVGFEVRQYTTKQQFNSVILPEIIKLIQRTGQLNVLLVYNGEFGSFKMGAWLQEAMERLHYMAMWNKVAVITDTHVVASFPDLFASVTAGEFRGFNKNELQEAIHWVGTRTNYIPK